MTRQERFVVIFLIIGAAAGFSYSYYKEFYPPININFKKPFHENTPEARRLDEIIDEAKTVNLNTATATELTRLKGIGPALAQRIVTYRRENGLFGEIEEVKNVRGIGPDKFLDIKDHITVE
ncbi:MAG: helix-hairpin-helix domain-containing protein [Candidatus Omnitrophica bacterium]|nr:helix-hairpin-helix domain-containing protein [Candidatus Omnitrophota bacterium]